MRQHFAVVIEYDRGTILADDVGQAIEDQLGDVLAVHSVTVVSVGKPLHDRLASVFPLDEHEARVVSSILDAIQKRGYDLTPDQENLRSRLGKTSMMSDDE